MAYIHAQKEGFPDFKSKLPSGKIWASPDKGDGYLRRSVLQSLGRRVGDELLPTDLVEAGTFTDTEPPTGCAMKDQIASIELCQQLQQVLKRSITEDELREGSVVEDDDNEDDDEEDD
jgi:hypothetical protein